MASLCGPQATLLVWLLDDDLSVLKATGRLLDSVGWKVQTFADPAAFLEHAAIHRPRVAVIDIGMPGISGLEVQNRLVTISPETRVIILTSTDDPAVRARAISAGASDFFVKGVNKNAFLAGIEKAATSR